jgi:Ala-tRNA(Pro) deacylase
MGIVSRIKELLDKEHVTYQAFEHNLAFTALETAQAQHLPGHQVIKSVLVSADGKWVLCVLPSTHKIDFDKFKKTFLFKEVTLAKEEDVASLFPRCEVGAMPPFGKLAGIPVYVDISLAENDAIAFNAGTHTDLLKIKYKDYIRIAKPIFGEFSVHI